MKSKIIFYIIFCAMPVFLFAETGSFSRSLSLGMRGADVRALQQFLNTDTDTRVAETGAGSRGNETEYFGPATKRAVIKFQEKYRAEVLVPVDLISGNGFFGAKTRGQVVALYQKSNPKGKELVPTKQSPFINSLTSSSSDTTVNASTFINTSPVLQAQAMINARIDRTNDYSIISHCVGNTTYDLCPKTDLNGDGKTNMEDLTIFMSEGNIFDVNRNTVIEVNDALLPAKSCFLKVPTRSVLGMLPVLVRNTEFDPPRSETVCGGVGKTMPPTTLCNGGTWIKASSLGNACATNSGFLTMPFGFVYGANGSSPGKGGVDGQYSNFRVWVNKASLGSRVNLTSLFVSSFLSNPPNCPSEETSCVASDPYLESNLGKITYTTVAQYDLNDDGTADFNAGGADMAVFNGCKGDAVSGACAQADFNNDGVIDARDLGFVNFMQKDIFGGSGFIPLGWKLDWLESMMFDPAGYTDKQIIKYCVGRTAFEKCGVADVDGDLAVTAGDLTTFATAIRLDFNGDGKVELK